MDKVPHDPHVAVTSLREGGAVEQGTVVVYQPGRFLAVRGTEYNEVCHTQTQVWFVQVWYDYVLLWLYVHLSFVFKR